MEALEEPPLSTTLEEGVKSMSSDEIIMNTEASDEMDACHTSNGVAESDDAGVLKNEQNPELVVETTLDTAHDVDELVTKFEEDYNTVSEGIDTDIAEVSSAETDNLVYGHEIIETEITTEIQEAESTEVGCIDDNVVMETGLVEVDGIVDNSAGNITFETEIFIENNAVEPEDTACDEPDSSNILSELGQNIELSEVLRSSDVSETIENNNCEQEVFNKEELLDILEGNDEEQSRKMISENFHADSKKLEEHLAIQQLSRLKGVDSRKKNRYSPKKAEKRQPKRRGSHIPKEVRAKVDETDNDPKEAKEKVVEAISSSNTPKGAKMKVSETTSSNHSSKEAKVHETNNDPSEAKGKVVEALDMNNTKGKVNEKEGADCASEEVKEKLVETISSNIALIEAKEKITGSSNDVPNKIKGKGDGKTSSPNVSKAVKVDGKPAKESIVNALVQDWSDDEIIEPEESSTLLEHSKALLDSTEELSKTQESVVLDDNIQNESHGDERCNAEVLVSDELTPNNKSCDELQPQRRLGRVIKKKVIFDPDNPDTFTKTKVHIKKEKDALPEKDQAVPSTPKRIKTDHTPQTPKTKSPVSKMQWKKPQPKNSKQSSKRLTEIDKLLMDEGAVNMICQLTPEAPKGNKNMKSKAEFIKNIQSNTPGTKEMKFRERKNKQGDQKKVGSEKHRLSLSSSIKSPAASEDFENHSADDSIIYRRHSSSSYSSSCMSPRRLSDVEGTASQVVHGESQEVILAESNHKSELFTEEKASTPRREIMNKSDCLSIKEKLNSKLSQALNKRKLSGFKSEKPSKVKKLLPVAVEKVSTDVVVSYNEKVAEICIKKAGSLFSTQIMKAFENLLSVVNSNKDITVTLITSECGSICSGLDLKPILDNVKHAQEIADQARSLMHTLEQHSKLVIVGVEGKTKGFSLALAGLCDVLLASENASFAHSERRNAALNPGAAVLTSRALPQNMLNNLIVFGKELSALEALQGGLVDRVIWPDRFQEQVRAIAKDIASQPFENILLKKQLLGLKKTGCDASFQTRLEKERDLLVNYWSSVEGMQLLRADMEAA